MKPFRGIVIDDPIREGSDYRPSAELQARLAALVIDDPAPKVEPLTEERRKVLYEALRALSPAHRPTTRAAHAELHAWAVRMTSPELRAWLDDYGLKGVVLRPPFRRPPSPLVLVALAWTPSSGWALDAYRSAWRVVLARIDAELDREDDRVWYGDPRPIPEGYRAPVNLHWLPGVTVAVDYARAEREQSLVYAVDIRHREPSFLPIDFDNPAPGYPPRLRSR